MNGYCCGLSFGGLGFVSCEWPCEFEFLFFDSVKYHVFRESQATLKTAATLILWDYRCLCIDDVRASRIKLQNKNTHLLQIEDVVVKIILQLFICIVDAELLKAVGLKVLKAKNVQDTNGQALENKSMNTNQPIMRSKKGNAKQSASQKYQYTLHSMM